MNWQQTHRGSSFYVEWMRGTLVDENPFSPIWLIDSKKRGFQTDFIAVGKLYFLKIPR